MELFTIVDDRVGTMVVVATDDGELAESVGNAVGVALAINPAILLDAKQVEPNSLMELNVTGEETKEPEAVHDVVSSDDHGASLQ
jgi:hypothetical protein